MNLSLQANKFVNSAHTGKTCELELSFGKNQSALSFKIHYTEEGTGDPLILIHSAGQSLYTWNKLFPELSKTYRVIALDLAGAGYSDAPAYCEYTATEHAQILNAFMVKLKIESAHFLAFSLGCSVAAAFAAENPEKVGRIVLMSPGGVSPFMPPLLKMNASRFFGTFASLLLRESTIRSILSECFLDLTSITDDMLAQYTSPLERTEIKRAARIFAANYDENEVLHNLAAIETPVHILHASDDRWRTSELVQVYFDVLKNGTSAVIRNAGHLMHEEKPEKVIAAINEFISPTNQSKITYPEDDK